MKTNERHYRVRSYHGTVHSMTDGLVYRLRGSRYTNSPDHTWGKADCGTLTSNAAVLTDEPVNCPKCSK